MPLFGIFSSVLDATIPGLGSNLVSGGTATFTITNSVIHTDDAEIRSPAMRLGNQTDDKIVMFSWDSEAGRRYQLQYKADWNAAGWTDVGNIITTTNGTTIAPQAIGRGA